MGATYSTVFDLIKTCFQPCHSGEILQKDMETPKPL